MGAGKFTIVDREGGETGCLLLSWQHIVDHVLSIYSKKVVDTFMRVNWQIGDWADRTVPSGSRDKCTSCKKTSYMYLEVNSRVTEA